MKGIIKRVLNRLVPERLEVIQAIRARRHSLRLQSDWGLTRLDEQFVASYGLIVRHGPFKGMQLSAEKTSGGLIPRLLGSYESELHPALHQIVQNPYRVVVDVGCAEGYYAVGLAKSLPSAVVYAFDLDPVARRVCRDTAKLNGVADRVRVRGRCSPQRLQDVLVPQSLVISDCEGYEFVLLSTERVSALREADIIIELHDQVDSVPAQTLIKQFQKTHSTQVFARSPRDPNQFGELQILPGAERARAIEEYRFPNQAWVVFTRKPSLV